MPTVLVANPKGGCGKTTISTQLAGFFAQAGGTVWLADADRQRSSLGWLGRRPASAAPIAGVDWSKEIGKPFKGADWLIVDAAAGLRRKQIEALVQAADLIILPVLPSAFDENATRAFLERLEELRPIAKGRKPVTIIGNRVRGGTRAAKRLESFFGKQGHQVTARLRDSQFYADAALNGLTLFDVPGKRLAGLRADWEPLLAFLDQIAAPKPGNGA